MFHVEMRSGMNVVREFNLSEPRLWIQFLGPLMADMEFTVEGHDFIPRKTRIKIYDGPELRPDQLGMGRGWQNVERTASDVTDRVLTKAREITSRDRGADAARSAVTAGSPLADALRERLIGRLSAGPVGMHDVVEMAADLMPESSTDEHLAAARQAMLELLSAGSAQLTR